MNRVEKTHLPVAALSHPGMKGKNNEDRFGVAAFRDASHNGAPVLLAILSDGIGGHRAGEVASEMAVNIISHHAAHSDGRQPTRILEEAIHLASQRIFEQAQRNSEQSGMGATCACAWIAGDRLYTATVGDSRIYLMRNNKIQQISTDHTWIQEALENGFIQPDQVSGHPNAHVIRRYLGSPTPPEVDFRIRLFDKDDLLSNQGFQLLPGDRLLLCSDGLTDLVEGEEILAAFNDDTLEDAGQRLVDMANARGGHDNITLIAVQVPAEVGATVPVAVPRRAASFPLRVLAGCAAVVLLAVLIGGLAGGWALISGGRKATATPTITAITLPATSLPQHSATPARTNTIATLAPPARTSTRTAAPTIARPAETVTPIRLSSPTATQPLPVLP